MTTMDCPTPPMGWSSWYARGAAVCARDLENAAQALRQSGLADLGYRLLAIDDGWQGGRGGRHGAIQPNERFTDLAGLCREIHGLGLRIGLYSTPWIGSYAGFIGSSAPDPLAPEPEPEPEPDPDPDGGYARLALPPNRRALPTQIFGAHPGSERLGVRRVGHWRFDRDLRQWADWGVDAAKLDWHPMDPPTAARLRSDLDRAGRPMLLWLSNAARLEDAAAIAAVADCWRTTGDIVDDWASIRGIARYQLVWGPWRRPGRWPDPDMLQLGWLRSDPARADCAPAPSRLTPAEQRFQFGAWCLLGAPLMLSCDPTRLDPDLIRLVGDPVALRIDQDPLGASPRSVWQADGVEVWTKPLARGRLAVGLLNFADSTRRVRFHWADTLGADPGQQTPAWPDRPPTIDWSTSGECELELPGHGLILLESAPAARTARAGGRDIA
jgi:alpha-galactosidase